MWKANLTFFLVVSVKKQINSQKSKSKGNLEKKVSEARLLTSLRIVSKA